MRKQRDWQKLYQTYLRNYYTEAAKPTSQQRGIGDVLSIANFKRAYLELELDQKLQIASGERKKLDVTRALIRTQKGRTFSSQDIGYIQSLAEQSGITFTKDELKYIDKSLADESFAKRYGDLVKEHYNEMIQHGFTSKKAAEVISYFYGS